MTILKKTFGFDYYEVFYLVEPEHDGMRLDAYIQLYLKTFSRELIKKKIAQGEVVILNRPDSHKPSSRVYTGEEIRLVIPRTIHEDEYWRGEKVVLNEDPEVVFEDEEILVISKPAYMSAHPTGRHLFNCATVIFEARRGIPIKSIHRLDRETSGILILGKTSKAAAEIGKLFEFEHEKVQKCYFFIGIEQEGFKGEMNFTAKERLGLQENDMMMEAYDVQSEDGKWAETEFKILHTEKGYLLGLAFPKTGRQHQIRVHAKEHGFPLVGDKLYLGSYKMFQNFKDNLAEPWEFDLMQIPRHALHAMALRIEYRGHKELFQSHLPHDLKEWIETKLEVKVTDLEATLTEAINNYFK
jgi:RluA family pseudouridine synthase